MVATRRLRMSTLLETRDGIPSNKDARLTNCILEQDGRELNLIKRPGFTLDSSPATGIGYGATVIQTPDGGSQLISFVDANMYATQVVMAGTFSDTTGDIPSGATANIPGSVLYYNDKWWVFNYYNQTSVVGGVYSSTDLINWTLVQASPGFNSVATLMAMPSIVYKGKMWVVGGTNAGSATRRVLNSTDGSTWTLVNATPSFTARFSPRLLVYNNLLWLIGGVASGGSPWQDVWYTSDGSTWTQATAAAAWAARAEHACFVLAGKMWVCGGTNSGAGTFFNDCYYSTDGVTWTQGTASAAWTARGGMGYIVLNNFAYIVGGRASTGSGTPSNEMWRSPDGITWTKVGSGIGFNAVCGGYASNSCGVSSLQTDGVTPYLFSFHSNTNLVSSSWNGIIYSGTTSDTAITITSGSNATLSLGGVIDISQTLDRTVIAIKNTQSAWLFTVAGQTLTQVTDADYPTSTVRGLVYLNGTFYVMDADGVIYGSATDDFTSWSALNFINAQSEPDGGVHIFKYNQYVVAFGQYTIEFFYDAGNASGSPLSPVQNAQMLIGCASADSVTQMSSSVFFIARAKASGQSLNPKVFVAKLNGTSYEPISTPDIDRILNADGLDGAYAAACVVLGHPCYVITLPTSNLNCVYDLKTSAWYIWTIGTTQSAQTPTSITCTQQTDGSGLVTVTKTSHGFADGDPVTTAGADQAAYNVTANITYVSSSVYTYPISTVPASPATGTLTVTGVTQGEWPMRCAFNYDGTQVFQDAATGSLYAMSDTTYTDNGVYIDTHARFEPFDQGLGEDGNSARKFVAYMDAITDKPASSTNLLVRWTDDDFQTYSNYRAVDISRTRARMTRCGSFYRRGIEIRHTASAAHRFKGFDLGIDQGV